MASLAALGCAAENGDDGACGGEDCMVPTSKDEMLAELDGFADPVAEWLRGAVGERGTVAGTFEDALAGVGDVLGCDSATERSFVVLSNAGHAPKGILTRCSDDPQTASTFFMILEPGMAEDDLDADHFRMVGWDPNAGEYHRYQAVATETDEMGFAVQPAFCLGCHGGPREIGTWVPIMNEMTNPWAQWNATPGFESFQFEESLPEAFVDAPVFEQVRDPERLDSASNFEPTIRAGIDRATAARLERRNDAAELEDAFALLQPLYCDESVNFVSEIHQSGEIRQSAVLDEAIRWLYLSLGTAWPWEWVRDDILLLTPPEQGEDPLVLMAVRGETTIQAERGLVALGILTAQEVLRVRALDHDHPVESSLRCDLYERGRARVLDGITPVAIEGLENGEAVRVLYDAIMQLELGDGTLVPLIAANPDDVIAFADAGDSEVAQALATGDLSALEVSLMELGAVFEAKVAAVEAPGQRSGLDADRRERGCQARGLYATAPLVPGAEDCF